MSTFKPGDICIIDMARDEKVDANLKHLHGAECRIVAYIGWLRVTSVGVDLPFYTVAVPGFPGPVFVAEMLLRKRPPKEAPALGDWDTIEAMTGWRPGPTRTAWVPDGPVEEVRGVLPPAPSESLDFGARADEFLRLLPHFMRKINKRKGE